MAEPNTDTIITIPAGSPICRVDMPGTLAGSREVYHCAPDTIGRLLRNLKSDLDVDTRWIDLLGASTPGIAITQRAQSRYLLLAFGERVRTVRHLHAPRHGREIGTVDFHLPPTVWLLKYEQPRDVLTNAWLWVTATKVTSVADPVQTLHFPYGNVYEGSGNVCWGEVAYQHLTSQDPMAVDNLFFATNFNDHIVGVGRFTPPYREVREWVRAQAEGNHPTVNWGGTAIRPFQEVIAGTLRG